MEKGWYVIQTYSGYEQKIEKILTRFMEKDPVFAAYCTAVDVPVEKVNVKNDKGELKVEDRKILPGYVLVELQLPDVGWNSVLSKIVGINGVSGFLTADPTGKNPPKALSRDEHKKILIRKGEVPEEKTFRPKQEFKNGEEVLITSGPFAEFVGDITEVYPDKAKLRAMVSIFGRETPVELEYKQIQKL